MNIEFQQALVFAIGYLLFVIIGTVVILIAIIAAIKTSNKCYCKYDWGKTIEGEKFPRCAECNEPFKVIS